MEDIHTHSSSLKGKIVVITGASRGVGRAAAEAFAREGCNLVITARGKKGIDEVVDYCRALNVKAVGIPADMSIAEDVEKVAAGALAIGGRIDIWVNNAGVMASGKFEEIPLEVHQQVIKTNLFGYMHGAYNAIKIFKEQDEGILINNISIGGFMPAPYSAVYSASKFGIRGMMECLQGEISNRRHIHICNLYPQLQNSTGNLHSAKYSGFDMTIPFIASDPRDTAAKIVELAKNPQKELFPDFKSAAITNTYKLLPKIITNAASAVVRTKMKFNEEKVNNPGNVLSKSKEPLRVYGNPSSKAVSDVKLALFAGIGISLGLFLFSKK
ncbi:SDR family NAD(P)-dependent oxidoreductase [Flavobacterium panacagri]|uniref:SDR family NAD(P)-dependent oxidoreductase n=1 Tax=Flavobacterium panacagri TaxID=3034146 RepID=UPI0025A5150E|nr:SDR family NAD(P)-dependent oxidoreductase [Flavobacterium panacagri]